MVCSILLKNNPYSASEKVWGVNIGAGSDPPTPNTVRPQLRDIPPWPPRLSAARYVSTSGSSQLPRDHPSGRASAVVPSFLEPPRLLAWHAVAVVLEHGGLALQEILFTVNTVNLLARILKCL